MVCYLKCWRAAVVKAVVCHGCGGACIVPQAVYFGASRAVPQILRVPGTLLKGSATRRSQHGHGIKLGTCAQRTATALIAAQESKKHEGLLPVPGFRLAFRD